MNKRIFVVMLFLMSFGIAAMAANKTSKIKYTSSNYDDLVSLFKDFRNFQKVERIDGIPDYSVKTLNGKRKELNKYKKRLEAINPNAWEVAKKANFVLVWAEMNGMQFYLDVLKPWSRDPVFYIPSQGGAGPVIELNLRVRDLPISKERLPEFTNALKALPDIYKRAKINLKDAKGDLANLALHYIESEAERYNNLAESLKEHHPELVEDAKNAAKAVLGYGKWLEENVAKMPAAAGIGIENYNWWLKNVHLFPYTHAQCEAIVDHEYSRIITFLKMEENRNRNIQPIEIADTSEEYFGRLDYALNYMLKWLERENIMTIPSWAKASDYSDPSEEREYTWGRVPTMDSRGRELEVLPGETHEFIGHLFDEFRLERDDRPIRGVQRLYNMDWIRSEGFAAGSEELFMMAGDLDERNRHGREIEYLMNASHCSLSIPDLKMHSNEITFDEARALCAEIMPYQWSDKDDRMVWYEQQSNLRFPAFHTGVVMGKSQMTKLFREKAMQQGREFKIRDFFDEFLAAGMIPMSLTRWEMIGDDSEIKSICPLIK